MIDRRLFVIVQRNYEFSRCDQKNAKIPADANPAQTNAGDNPPGDYPPRRKTPKTEPFGVKVVHVR